MSVDVVQGHADNFIDVWTVTVDGEPFAFVNERSIADAYADALRQTIAKPLIAEESFTLVVVQDGETASLSYNEPESDEGDDDAVSHWEVE